MKVTAFIGDNGEVLDLFEQGRLVLFEQGVEGWREASVRPLSLHREMGMAEVKAKLQEAVRPLQPCDAFLMRDFRGVLRVFLEECGFRAWMSSGPLLEQLDKVAQGECELAKEDAAAQQAIPAPICVGDPDDGVFRIDLVALLAAGSCHVSHELIMPFLETTAFARLEVFCDHAPKWFAREFEELDLTVGDIKPDPTGNGMTITIVPKVGPRSQPPGRRPGKSSCRCG